jgi:hypothetical protein
MATANPAMSPAVYRRARLAATPAQALTLRGTVLKTAALVVILLVTAGYTWSQAVAYDRRDVGEELALVELTRGQMARVLRALGPEEFRRRGRHARDGALTLEELLRRVTAHVPHHVRFVEQKRRALA